MRGTHRIVNLLAAVALVAAMLTFGAGSASAQTFCEGQGYTCTYITSDFNGTAIKAGNYIWFNSVIDAHPRGSSEVKFTVDNVIITFTANGQLYTLHPSPSEIYINPDATKATTTYSGGRWYTEVPASYGGNVFLSGYAFQVPANFSGGIKNVTWQWTMHVNPAIRPMSA